MAAQEHRCTVCDGRVVVVVDPEIKHRQMIYCKDCATQFARVPDAPSPQGDQ